MANLRIRGSVDTKEKFEAKPAVIAEKSLGRHEGKQLSPCQNFHSVESMDAHKQSSASEVMMLAMQSGESTCIDCHKGIEHHLPK